jgi:hypothetical protein
MPATILLVNPLTNADMLVEYEKINERRVNILSVYDERLGDVVLPPNVALACRETIRGLTTRRVPSEAMIEAWKRRREAKNSPQAA